MMKKKVNYQEGDCFAIPLRKGGFARGVIARMNGKGSVFGYFFSPKIAELADVRVDAEIRPENAIYKCCFGDLGLLMGEWTPLGALPDWTRKRWPMPSFLYHDEDGKTGFLRQYDEDTLKFVREERIPLSGIHKENFPEDGLMGYGAVEKWLTKLLI
jgi:hypothetical protein